MTSGLCRRRRVRHFEPAIEKRQRAVLAQDRECEHEGRDRSNLAFANASTELAKAHIDKTRIVAPFAGIVGLRQVSVGEYITPGQPLVGLDAIERIKVDFKVPEKYLPTVRTGQHIEIKVDA